jgi:triphosphatase
MPGPSRSVQARRPSKRRRAGGPKGPSREAALPFSPAEQIETEWQFDAPHLDAVEDWLQRRPDGGGVRVGPPAVRRLRDLYLDTRDWKVFRAGYAFRLRQVGRAVEATLKAVTPRENGLVSRREITQPVTRPATAALYAASGPVADRLRRLCKARELRAFAEVRTTRRRFPLSFRAAPAGEVTLDRSSLAGTRGPQGRILRVEAEVPAAMVEKLWPFVKEMCAAGGLTPARRSKYEWALAAKQMEPVWPRSLGTDRVAPAMTLGEAAYAVLRQHFEAVLRHEPGTRLGEDPEHLHDMRVAARRMRAALRVFADALPAREREVLRIELRDLGRTLGAVRDRDVQRVQIEGWRRDLVTVEPAALDPFLEMLDARRREARAALLERLDAPRTRSLLVALEARLRRGADGRVPGASVPLRAAAPRIITRARKKLMRQAKSIGPESPPSAYHRTRILGKRMRYALEFVEPIYGAPARALIDPLVELQDILGLHQDAYVCMRELPALARKSHLPPETRAAVGEIAQLYAAQAARQRGLFPAVLRKLRGKGWKALKQAMEKSLSELGSELAAAQVARATGKDGGAQAPDAPVPAAPAARSRRGGTRTSRAPMRRR